MQTLTFEAIKGVLSADGTVPLKQRNQILQFMKSGAQESSPPTPALVKLLRRQEVADRFNINVRTVDLWAAQGLLNKVKLPGRQRACGFPSDQVDALVRGEM